MRRIRRLDLPTPTQRALDRQQATADASHVAGALNVERTWKSARQTRPLKTALGILRTMAGPRQRCMYCGDSHGTDMDHFWPKQRYPGRMFRWLNLLLSCTECGRFKGADFPLKNDAPLLVDPTAENPWQFLEFNPATGNIVARFDPAANDWTLKGTSTVAALHLDRREALAASYQRTDRRLRSLVEAALQQPTPDANALAAALRDADDHGLLGWYFEGTGNDVEPFARLARDHPAVWRRCAVSLH